MGYKTGNSKWKKQERQTDLKEKERKRMLPWLGLLKEKCSLMARKLNSDNECDENGASGPVKRVREETEEPISKQQKTKWFQRPVV